MISVTIIPARYRVRQTFFSFGADCEETLNTMEEAEAYGREIAEGLAQVFFRPQAITQTSLIGVHLMVSAIRMRPLSSRVSPRIPGLMSMRMAADVASRCTAG
jgi:hypothetical protein